MSKKAVFLVERNLYYKFFSPWIEELLKNNIDVHLIHYSSGSLLSSSSSKLFYYPQLNQVPQFSKPVTNYHKVETSEDLNQCLSKYNFDYIFSLHPKGYCPNVKTNAKWITLQHGVDSTKYKDQASDCYVIYSKKWFEEPNALSRSEVFEAGLYYTDQKSTDRESILNRYNLSSKIKYVLFIPLPAGNHQSYFFWPFKFLNFFILKYLVRKELHILQKLKRSFDKSGIQILIKSRFKRFLPKSYHEYGQVFYDDLFYPCTTSDLVSISEHVYINYMPGAIITEIAALAKPYTYIHYPKLDKYTFKHIKGFMKNVFLPEESSPNWVHHKDTSALENYSKRATPLSPSYVENYVSPKNKLSLDTILKRIL